MRCLWLTLLTTALSISTLPAQQPTLAGPIEAFTFDAPTQSIRAVMGVPGSSFFGPALATGLDTGSVAPRANYAIAFQQGTCMLVSGLDTGVASTTALNGVSGLPDRIAWSADGSTAALFSVNASWVQVIKGLPSAPDVQPPVDISPVGGKLAAVAVDPHGQSIAFAVQGDNGGVFLLDAMQPFTPLFQTSLPRGLAFSEDGSTLYLLDGVTSQLDALTVNDSGLETFRLDGLQDPAVVASGQDSQGHQVVYIGSGQDHILRVYDPAAQQILTDLPLDFAPTGISALGRHSFVLASRAQASDPLWIFTSSPQTAVYFVPAAQSAGGVE